MTVTWGRVGHMFVVSASALQEATEKPRGWAPLGSSNGAVTRVAPRQVVVDDEGEPVAVVARGRAGDRRVLAEVEAVIAAERAAALEAQPPPPPRKGPRLVTLREAAGWVGMGLDAARKRRQRDPTFPAPSNVPAPGGAPLYDPRKFRAWAQRAGLLEERR